MRMSKGKRLLRLGAAALSVFWLTSCASIGPPQAPSLELPKPPTDLRAARKGNQVTLSWTVPSRTTDRQSVRYLGKTEICRSIAAPLKQCGTPIGDAAPPPDFREKKQSTGKKFTATFTDNLASSLERDHSIDFATYAVEVLNAAGRGAGISNQARVSLVPTLAPFDHFGAHAVEAGIDITWQCPELPTEKNLIGYLFRIYRRPAYRPTPTKIADVDATACAIGTPRDEIFKSFLDQTFEWENTYFYRGTVVSLIEAAGKTEVEVEGDDTPEIKIFAHDVFPPAVPRGLQAVFSGPGQQPFIDLIWAPVGDADLEGYNVYRHEDAAPATKVNSELVKSPAYRDMNVVAGKTYSYSVSAVDERGNESAPSEEASESVP